MITLCLIENKNLSSKEISFSKVIPWSLVHDNFTGDWSVNLLFPCTDQIVLALGISIFLSLVIKPLSTRYPSLVFLGAKSLTFSSLSKLTLYSLNVKSSIAAPFKDIDPTTLWFSNWILSLWPKASSLEISVTFSFWSRLGASLLCSVLFFSTNCSLVIGGGAKYSE